MLKLRYLFSSSDSPIGEDDDAKVAIHFDRLGHAIRVARVVDVARQAAAQRGVDDALFVQSEHVNASIGRVVALLSALGQLGADHLADVLDNHRVLLYVAGGVQAEALDLGAGQIDVVTPLLLHLLVLGALRVDELLRVRPRKVGHHQTG